MQFASRLVVLLLVFSTVVPACRRRAPQFAPDKAEVHGRVLGPDGRPPGGAQATLERDTVDGTVEAARARPDDAGFFVLAGLAPGRYRLRVEAPGRAVALVRLDLGPGDRLSTVVRLDPAQILQGVVEDRRGRPLAGARLMAFARRQGKSSPPLETQSGADGRFSFPGLSRGSWTLLAEAPGFGTLQIDLEMPSPPVAVRMAGEGRSLGGLVLDARGRGRTGARVVLGGPGLSAVRQTKTGARGTFLFEGLGPGRYSVRASEGSLSSPALSHVIEEDSGWVPPFRLTLEPGALIKGRVIDHAGRPLPGAAIELSAMPADDLPETVRAGAGGIFTAGPLPPGRYQVVARMADHVSLDSSVLRLRADVTPSMTLRLARAAGLTGRVVDIRAAPVSGAAVVATALVGGVDDLTVLPGRLPLAVEAAELVRPALTRRGPVQSTTTDAQGRFQVDGLSPGQARLEVSHPDSLPYLREPLFLAAGEGQDLGEVVLDAGVRLAGRVLDEADRPLEGAQIEARSAGPSGQAVFRASSDGQGRFVLRVPEGDYTLVALASGRAPQSVYSLRADTAAAAKPMELRLPRAEEILRGQVRGPGGRTIARARVVALAAPLGLKEEPGALWRPRDTREVNGGGTLTLAAASADRDGRFVLTGLPSGPVILEARHPDWAPAAQIVAASQPVAISLARPGGIEGEIREVTSGTYVARYELEAIGPQGRRPERIQREGAGFIILGLQPGRWLLRVRSPGFAPAEKEVEVPPGVSAKRASLSSVRIELTRGGS